MRSDVFDVLVGLMGCITTVVVGLGWWTDAITTAEVGAVFCMYVVIGVVWMCEVHTRGEK